MQDADSGWPTIAPPPPRKNARRVAVIICTLIVVAAIAAGTIIATIVSRPGCLSKKEYAELTGIAYVGDLQPTASFYTTPITWSGTDTLDTKSAEQVDKIINFYKKYQSKSIQITVASSFSSLEDKASSQARVLALQDAFTSGGVPAAVLALEQPQYTTSEDSEAIMPASFTVSVTSVEGCR